MTTGAKISFIVLSVITCGVICEEGGEQKPELPPALKFDEIFRLRLKHDVAESVEIIKKSMEFKKAKNMVEKVLTTVLKDMKNIREEQLLKFPANPDALQSGSFPNELIDVYVNLATNLLIFSNVVLYQPDLSRAHIKRNSKIDDSDAANNIIEWAIDFCRDKGVFTNHTKANDVVHLMEQELEFVPRRENYQNPYAYRHKVEQAREEFEQKQKELEDKKDKMKKPLKRGPRISEEL